MKGKSAKHCRRFSQFWWNCSDRINQWYFTGGCHLYTWTRNGTCCHHPFNRSNCREQFPERSSLRIRLKKFNKPLHLSWDQKHNLKMSVSFSANNHLPSSTFRWTGILDGRVRNGLAFLIINYEWQQYFLSREWFLNLMDVHWIFWIQVWFKLQGFSETFWLAPR